MQLNFINNLLDLKEIKVNNLKISEDNISIFLNVTLKESTCPVCSSKTSRIADYRNQVVKDIPIHYKNTFLHIRKKRFLCSCGKKFYPKLSFLPRYHRMTNRLSAFILQELRESQSMKLVARRANVSSHTVQRIFSFLDYSNPSFIKNPPKVLSIDEFKGNAGGKKFQCILVDPIKHKILDILQDRKDSFLSSYFKKMRNRNQVEYFVTDMYSTYVNLAKVYFPKAKIVIDRFHFIRQCIWAMESVRKRIQKQLDSKLRKYFKRSKKLILAKKENLDEDSKRQLELMLLYNEDLRQAHGLKELFYKILETKSYVESKKLFIQWIDFARSSRIVEFEKCAKTYSNWFKEIVNSFEVPYSNGCVEGFNNKIKVLKRISYGYRNFNNFKRKIMHSCS